MAKDDLALVERLRSVDISWSELGEWCAEAADRITTLEAENAKLRADNAALVEEATVVCPKNDDRLRTAPEAGQ